MKRTEQLEAIVLKTYDVGEADRYCVFFTRERGKVTARASGVRRMKSRMGGAIIPFQHLTLELKRSGVGWIVAGAAPCTYGGMHADLASFALCAQGCELLLRLVQEEEESSEAFEATLAFFRACDEGIPHVLLAYTLRLLHLFGFLPDEREMFLSAALTEEERLFLHAACGGYFLRGVALPPAGQLPDLCRHFLENQLSSPLKAPGVVAAMEQ
jgi:DNA repair protein RecO